MKTGDISLLLSETLFKKSFRYEYNQTCIRGPLLGPIKSGCLGQVVVLKTPL